MRKILWLSVIGLAVSAPACTTSSEPSGPDDQPAQPAQNALGIVAWQTTETAIETTMVGVDAQSNPIAKVDLVSGTFDMSDYFAAYLADGASRAVDGRRLVIELKGTRVYDWESADHGTVLLTAPPAQFWQVATIVEDPAVKSRLDLDGIGFQAFQGVEANPADPGDGETPYYSFINTNAYGVDGWLGGDYNTCFYTSWYGGWQCNGTPPNKPKIFCGGGHSRAMPFGYGYNAISVVHQRSGIEAPSGYSDQDVLFGCCGDGTPTDSTPFYATQTCGYTHYTNCGDNPICSPCGQYFIDPGTPECYAGYSDTGTVVSGMEEYDGYAGLNWRGY